MIGLCTILTGGKDCSDMALFGELKEPFLRQLLRLRHGIPSHDTFNRVFRLLDPAPFEVCFARFMRRFAETSQGVVAIDGKTLRRSFDRAAGQSPPHMIHAWSADQRWLLGQLAVDGKSNEITAELSKVPSASADEMTTEVVPNRLLPARHGVVRRPVR